MEIDGVGEQKSNLPIGDYFIDCLGNAVGMIIEAEMSQKHGSRQQECCRVGLIFALDVETDVSTSWFENGHITTHVATRDDTRSTNKSRSNVGKDTTVEIGHNHNVELLRSGDSLHGSVVDDHVIDFQCWIILANLLDRISEKTVCEFHDVGLVDAGDLLSVVCESERKGKLGDAFGLGSSDDFEGFDHARDRLVL